MKPGEPIDVVGEFATDDPDITARMVIVAPINAAKATLGDVIVQDKNPGTALFRFETRVKAPQRKGRYFIRAIAIEYARDRREGAVGLRDAKTQTISASFEVY